MTRRDYVSGGEATARIDHRSVPVQRAGGSSAFGDSAENRFHVDDRCAVEGLQVVHVEAESVDGQDGDSMEAEGVGAVRGASAEDACCRAGRVASWMDCLYGAVGSVEPGDQDEFVAGRDVGEGIPDGPVEDHPRIRRPFISLPRRIRTLAQPRLHPPDRTQNKLIHGHKLPRPVMRGAGYR
jgi:hypothetical protein